MSNDNKSIHEFDFSLICEYFSSLERQGPGSTESTIKALSFIDNLTCESHIADLGCGTGAQTIVLAQNTPAKISAIDLFDDFVSKLNNKATELGLQNRITGITGSMENLAFIEEELDLIWSEGAIYNIGFEKGVNYWKKYLKPEGYLAITEASWLTDVRPREIESFWNDAYPEIDTISNKISILQKAGYVALATFILPTNCWTDNFYVPQRNAQKLFIKKYANNKTAEELVANQLHEANLYAKYKDYYGYVFYICKKMS